MIRILVYDDVRIFHTPKLLEWARDCEIVYCRTEKEFLEYTARDLEEHGPNDTGIDVLVLDHDLELVFLGSSLDENTTRRSCKDFVENRLPSIPLEKRPTVVIVSANPAGAQWLFELFYNHCTDVWKDYCGRKIGLTG